MQIPTNTTPDLDTRAGRMLAAGRLTATVTSHKTGQHITIQIKCCRNVPDAPYGKKWPTCPPQEATHVFIKAGKNDDVGRIVNGRYYADRDVDRAREFAAAMVLRYACGEQFDSEIVESDQCGRCGRDLTDPVSIARGIGPECFGKETASQHETKRPQQLRMGDPERADEKAALQQREQTEDKKVAAEKLLRDNKLVIVTTKRLFDEEQDPAKRTELADALSLMYEEIGHLEESYEDELAGCC